MLLIAGYASAILLGVILALFRLKWLSAPFVQALISFSLVFIGLLGSLYSIPIKSAMEGVLPKVFVENSFVIGFFWWSVTISLLIYFFSQREVSKSESERVDELKELINSMPPKNFVEHYAEFCSNSFEVITDTERNMPTLDVAALEERIRILLRIIISAVRSYWWQTSTDNRYSANIMIAMKPKQGLQVHFEPPAFDATKLKCALRLFKELSATSASKTTIDDKVVELVLPIFPQADKRIIPGAPEAFEENYFRPVADVREWSQWLEGAAKFDQDVRDGIVKYFQSADGREIRSFVSIPLSSLLPDGTKTAFGVLNLHSNKVGPWSNEKTSKMLIDLISPFLDHLVLLLKHWKDKKNLDFFD